MTRDLSGVVVYVSLHSTMYTTTILLSALRLERYTAAIIFPHNKMVQKNSLNKRDSAPLKPKRTQIVRRGGGEVNILLGAFD